MDVGSSVPPEPGWVLLVTICKGTAASSTKVVQLDITQDGSAIKEISSFSGSCFKTKIYSVRTFTFKNCELMSVYVCVWKGGGDSCFKVIF